MYFDSVSSLIAMDGHGAFVWSAYGITAVVLVALLVAPMRRRRRLMAELKGEARRAAANSANSLEAEGS